MAYNELLAKRTRAIMSRRKGLSEKKMFGGVGFLLNGNMCCGVWKQFLILRLGDGYKDALKQPHFRKFDITGRAMSGWAMVEPEGIEDDDELKYWVRRAAAFASSLPVKNKG